MMVLEVSANSVWEFRNPCSNHDNPGLMMWAKAQDTWQKTMVNKTNYKDVTVRQHDLQ